MVNETEGRILALKRPVWIGYPRAQEILNQMESVFNYPSMHRMPNLAIIGDTNNGKTMLLNTFVRRQYGESQNIDEPEVPILMVQAPPEPSENRLYSDILTKLFARVGTRESTEAMLQRVRLLFQNLGIKMLIIDEFQHALAGTGSRLRRFLNGIKFLGNELQIPIVVAGTPETLNVLQSDPQVTNRFEPLFLAKWTLDENFFRLLVTIESHLGLKKKSILHSPDIAVRLYDESEGTIGELIKLVHKLAEVAIRNGTEQITAEMLTNDHLKNINWYAPSIRNRTYRK